VVPSEGIRGRAVRARPANSTSRRCFGRLPGGFWRTQRVAVVIGGKAGRRPRRYSRRTLFSSDRRSMTSSWLRFQRIQRTRNRDILGTRTATWVSRLVRSRGGGRKQRQSNGRLPRSPDDAFRHTSQASASRSGRALRPRAQRGTDHPGVVGLRCGCGAGLSTCFGPRAVGQ